MSKYFSFAGMQRSGNHAIINWWLSHFNEYSFRNNILGPVWEDKEAQKETDNYTWDGMSPRSRCFIDSWENYSPQDIEIAHNSQPLIVILRDPWNWWASWLWYADDCRNANVWGLRHIEETIPWYIKYAKYARDNPTLFVNFNSWFLDSEYRRKLERQWNMNECDDGLEQISVIGRGSTFDGLAFEGHAQEMGVLTRYERAIDFPAYREPLRQYPELADISRKLFNMEPPENIYV